MAEAQAEQAAAASLVDTLELVDPKDCMACSRVCGERFSHLTMTTKAKGFKGQFVCMDREACLQLSGGGAMERARKAAVTVTHARDRYMPCMVSDPPEGGGGI